MSERVFGIIRCTLYCVFGKQEETETKKNNRKYDSEFTK